MGSILRSLGFIGRIQLSILGIRLAILLSLGEVKSLFLALTQSRISSLVYSIQSSLCIVLYKDCIIMTYLFLSTHTPWSRRRVCRLQIVAGLQALKIAFIKSAKSSQYCSYRSLSISSKCLYLRILKLIQSSISFVDITSTPYLHFF